MRRRLWFSLLIMGSLVMMISLFWKEALAIQDDSPLIIVQSPQPGQAIQGKIPVVVELNSNEFLSAELYFAYHNNPTDTWFFVNKTIEPANGILAEWDTTLITDGIYDLKLIVTFQDNSQFEVLVPGVRVRNYSPIETDTPTPILATATLLPGDMPIPTITSTQTITPSPTITLTPTPLPTNPAVLSSSQILISFGRGFIVVLVIFLSLGVYLSARAWLRNRQAGG